MDSVLFPGDHNDMFRVQAEDSLVARALLTPSSGVDIVLRVFNEAGVLIDEADDGGEGERESVEASVDPDEIAILAVFAFDDTAYTLQVTGSAALTVSPRRTSRKIAELEWIPTLQGEVLFVTLAPHALLRDKVMASQQAAFEFNLAAAVSKQHGGAPHASLMLNDALTCRPPSTTYTPQFR